jgi:hypothetical protein
MTRLVLILATLGNYKLVGAVGAVRQTRTLDYGTSSPTGTLHTYLPTLQVLFSRWLQLIQVCPL